MIRDRIQSAINLKTDIIDNDDLIKSIESAAFKIIDTYKNKGKVFFCGNGGSAADAQHLAAELSGRFYYDRPPLFAEALHVNTSYLTAVANDYSYDEIYARYIRGAGQENDVIVGISTSGNSKNIVKAFQEARKKSMKIIAFTGESGGEMRDYCDVLINVPSSDTPRIQEAHILIGHIICEMVESELFPR